MKTSVPNLKQICTHMNRSILALCFLVMSAPWSVAQQVKVSAPAVTRSKAEQEIANLSEQKWRWMSERKVDSLAALFDDQSVFVHMGGTWGKTRELDVIKSGDIWYRDVDIQE